MKSQNLCSTLQGHTDKSMTSEQFAQVIEAILAGKYSWACLLILRFAGYNPLHYIPYRTFNRLLKENIPSRKEGKNQIDKSLNHYQVTKYQAQTAAQNAVDQIPDLAYLHPVDEEPVQVRGGDRSSSWTGESAWHSDRLLHHHKYLTVTYSILRS